MPGDPHCHAESIWVDDSGRELFVGCEWSQTQQEAIEERRSGSRAHSTGSWIAHSSDGGATFHAAGGPLPIAPGHRSPVFAMWGRNARDVWAVGYLGSLWHTGDGERWVRVEGAGSIDLLGVGGNSAGMVVAVGDRGRAVISRDGVHFTVERSGCRGRLRAVRVDDEGRVIAVSERAEIAVRDARGRWTLRRRASRGDVFARLILDDTGGLVVLSEAGRPLRSTDHGTSFHPLPALPLASRSYCDDLAISAHTVTLLCHRARPGTEMFMEPPMEHHLLVGPPAFAGPWREEPLPGAVSGLFARSSGDVTWAAGSGVWRRE